MSRLRSRARALHEGLGLLLAGGALLVVVTGLALQHPAWLGRPALGPAAAAADPAVPDRLLRAAPGLLEESRDAGRSWRELPLLLAPARPVDLAFAPDGATVWLLGDTELLVSRDGGAVWEAAELPPGVHRHRPALDLAVSAAGLPLVASAGGAWLRDGPDGEWRELWHVAPTAGDRLRGWVRALHAGRVGPPWVARVWDLAALLFLGLLFSGLVLARRHRRRRRTP